MKLADVDWSILRGPITLMVVAVLVSVALLGGSYYFWSTMDSEYRKQNSRLLAIRRKYQTVDDEEQIIETFLPRFEKHAEVGVIGPENRLDWIEALRGASEVLKLPSVRYSIESQRVYEPGYEVNTQGSFQVFASEMVLDIGLLHEGDLPRLLEELNIAGKGLYTVSSCQMRRVRAAFSEDPNEINLQADCRLRWLTIKPKEGGNA